MLEGRRANWNDVLRNEGGLSGRVNYAVYKSASKFSFPGAKVLEVGPGRGDTAVELSTKGRDVYVADIFAGPLQATVSLADKQKVKVEPVLTNGESLGFMDGVFDLVYSQGLVEHFPDPVKILSEMARVVAPGGHLLVDVPHKPSLLHLIKTPLIESGEWPFGWETSFTAIDLENRLNEQNLQVLKRETYYWGIAVPIPQKFKPKLASLETQGGGIRSKISGAVNLARRLNTTPVGSKTGFLLNNIGMVAKKPN